MYLARAGSAFSIAAALLFLTACGTAPEPRACQRDGDCPADAYCTLGACIAGSLPEAKIAVVAPAGMVSHRVILFDGTGSVDRNPSGALTEYAWKISRATTTSCDPSATEGKEKSLSTVFTCSGDYEVQLKVKNALGLEHARSLQVLVAPSMNPPEIVTMGEDLQVGHRCGGSPLVCEALQEDGTDGFQLSVLARDAESGDALSYQWSYDPPAGIDRGSATVSFEPDRYSRSPIVRIETPGTRIAGDWSFRVAVIDTAGLVAPGSQKVTVRNRPPRIASPDSLSLAHQYQSPNEYRVRGLLDFEVIDEDGDPLDSASLELGPDLPPSCSFDIEKSSLEAGQFQSRFSLKCALAQDLMKAGPQLIGSIRDVNGETGKRSVLLDVLNQPPQVRTESSLSVPHRVAPCTSLPGSCYVIEGEIFAAVSSPDGDPTFGGTLVLRDHDPAIATWKVDPSGTRFVLEVSTDHPYLLRRQQSGKGGPVFVTGVVSDPFERSSELDPAATVRVDVENHPPRLVEIREPTVPLSYDPSRQLYYIPEAILARLVDDDGDPVDSGSPAVVGASHWVSGGILRFGYTVPFDWTSGPLPNLVPVHQFSFDPADAWESGPETAMKVNVTLGGAPSLVSATWGIGCECGAPVCTGTRYWRFSQDATQPFDYTISVAQPNGLPVRVTLGASHPECFTPQAATVLPGQPFRFSARVGNAQSWFGCGRFSMTLSDGQNTTVLERETVCPLVGTVCGSGPVPVECSVPVPGYYWP